MQRVGDREIASASHERQMGQIWVFHTSRVATVTCDNKNNIACYRTSLIPPNFKHNEPCQFSPTLSRSVHSLIVHVGEEDDNLRAEQATSPVRLSWAGHLMSQ